MNEICRLIDARAGVRDVSLSIRPLMHLFRDILMLGLRDACPTNNDPSCRLHFCRLSLISNQFVDLRCAAVRHSLIQLAIQRRMRQWRTSALQFLRHILRLMMHRDSCNAEEVHVVAACHVLDPQ